MTVPTPQPAPPTPIRERVIAAARETVAAGASPTLTEIAGNAGVSRATLHRIFGSREELLRILDIEPDPSTRERVLAKAIAMLEQQGLARLSMDELASRSGVSRANIYRLFPGKSALFRELVRVYSPLGPVGQTVTELGHRPPEEVMPAIARALARHLDGRVGLVRALLFEVSGTTGEAEAAREFALAEAIGPLAGYLLSQMTANRLRPMHPLLALQAFAGPIVMHLITRHLAERLLGFDLPLEEVVVELAEAWVRAMQPAAEES
jgi:AcrR family transcriptional regulator